MTVTRSGVVEDPVFVPLEISQEQTDDGLLKGLLLCGNTSKNGYSIPPSAFGDEDRVRALYEGQPIYFNHTDKNKHPFSRESDQIAGVISNAYLKNGRPYGDVKPFNSNRGKLLQEVVLAQPRNYGLSHIAKYDLDTRNKIVRRVEEVFSVDVVLNPATTKTFREQKVGMNEEMFREQITDLKSERKELSEQIASLKQDFANLKAELTEKDKEIARLSAENKTLTADVEKFRQEQALLAKREAVIAECTEAGLDTTDAKIVSKLFLESLLNASSDEARAALIAERVELTTAHEKAPAGPAGTNGVFYRERTANHKQKEFKTEDVLAGISFRH